MNTAVSIDFAINGRRIGPSEPPYIVAELSANHQGSLERALQLIEAAKSAGADAVKLQTYTPDTITIDYDGPGFVIESGLWAGRTLYDLYSEAYTPWEWHKPLFTRARELGLAAFSAPFDLSAVKFLETLSPPAYKLASFELTDTPLLKSVAATQRPLILSTGLASLGEIETALHSARETGCRQIMLLHCVSGYPTPIEESNLRSMKHLAETFHVPVGLSDHTPGIAAPLAAVALGGCLVEKHFTLSREDGGPDSAFSLEPHEFKLMAENCRNAWKALGVVNFTAEQSEKSNSMFRRSLYVVRDIAKGEPFTSDNVRSIRPGFGLPSSMLERVLSSLATQDISFGTPLQLKHVAFKE